MLFIVVLHMMLWFKTHRLGFVQPIDLLNMIQLMNILSRFKQDTYSSALILRCGCSLTFKRLACVAGAWK